MTPTNAAELELSAHTGRALPCDLGGGIYKAAMLILRMYMKKLNLQNWGPSQRSHSQCETSSKSITTPTTLSLEQSSQGHPWPHSSLTKWYLSWMLCLLSCWNHTNREQVVERKVTFERRVLSISVQQSWLKSPVSQLLVGAGNLIFLLLKPFTCKSHKNTPDS